MNFLRFIFSNQALNAGALAWVAAQVLKTIFYLLMNKKFEAERLFGAGGMPSSHSAMVTALMIVIARIEGFNSSIFALSAIFAGVVMYDAMGVRRAAGEHAKLLNKLVLPDFINKLNKTDVDKDDDIEDDDEQENRHELKEFLGHTPMEVLGGALLGILIAMLLPSF